MLRALANSAAGIDAQSKRVEIISNNIANINTIGYKKQDISFADLYYQQLAKPGMPVNANPPNERPVMQGSGVKVSATERDFAQGMLFQTGRDLDFAISGAGFFEVELPSGDVGYTRNGVLNVDDEGWLMTAQGYRLTAEVMIGPEFQEVTISSQGIVTGKNLDGESEELGYWSLYDFANPAGLQAIGENLFVATEASGELLIGMPGEAGFGEIKQGFVENANVSLAEEMTSIIEAQRVYQMNSRALQAADEMWAMANNIKR